MEYICIRMKLSIRKLNPFKWNVSYLSMLGLCETFLMSKYILSFNNERAWVLGENYNLSLWQHEVSCENAEIMAGDNVVSVVVENIADMKKKNEKNV